MQSTLFLQSGPQSLPSLVNSSKTFPVKMQLYAQLSTHEVCKSPHIDLGFKIAVFSMFAKKVVGVDFNQQVKV